MCDVTLLFENAPSRKLGGPRRGDSTTTTVYAEQSKKLSELQAQLALQNVHMSQKVMALGSSEEL